jgi:hypothetical protein
MVLTLLTTPEAGLVVAGIALIGTALTVVQKRYADHRIAWWTRTQWALDHILATQGEEDDDDTERTVALLVLNVLQASRLARREETSMLEQVADVILASAPGGRHERQT